MERFTVALPRLARARVGVEAGPGVAADPVLEAGSVTNTTTVRARTRMRPAVGVPTDSPRRIRLHTFRPFGDMTIQSVCRWCFGWYDDPRHA